MTIPRTQYLQKLSQWRNTQIIKVVTGIRRCGKSTLLQQVQDELLSDGVMPEQILSVNFEDLAFEDLQDYRRLYEYVCAKLHPEQMHYVFLDEIQRVPHFEKAVDSLYILDNVDIYITGSNSFLLSGELATLLSGRYIEIFVLPFSFAEYRCAFPHEDTDALFAHYLQEGGFPYLSNLAHDAERIGTYLEGIYNTIIIKDIEARENRKLGKTGDRGISDLGLLRSIAKFLASSIGSPISYKSITDYLVSAGRKISQNTVAGYVDMLREAYVFHPVERFDISGKQLMKTNQKVYIADIGLRRYLLSRKTYDIGFTLENIVYLELLRRGFRINVGKQGNTEVDFVAHKSDAIYYVQVTASLLDASTFEREIKPLRSIRDNHGKTMLTLDKYSAGNYDGIRVMNVVDWLLGRE